MPTPDEILHKVTVAIESLISIADSYDGLIPSIIDRHTQSMMTELPPAIPGQRDGDRSHLGSNLIHDEALLLTMYGLSEAEGRSDFSGAADRYLERFVTHCTNTPTGIFPWGEHAYWHLVDDKVGNSYLLRDRPGNPPVTHDHLRQAPLWLWEKIHDVRPECVYRFGEGLDGHWSEGEPKEIAEEYIRHAYTEDPVPYQRGKRSCDFPRHGGFYIFDWAFAYLKSGRTEFADRIRRMLGYWWPKRDDLDLLLIESRSPAEDEDFHQVNAPGQTLSLGVSLLEASPLVRERDDNLAEELTTKGRAYIDAFFRSPHDLDSGVFALLSKRGTNEIRQKLPIWGSVYGVWPASYVALTCLCGYRLTEDERLLEWAASVGEGYCSTPFPSESAIPAMDAGLGLGLLADLYDLTSDRRWLDGGLRLAERLLEVYCDNAIPRGAPGIAWYESQMGPGFLIHGLARIALMARDGLPCPLAADYTAR
jgi:hypothetical protein